MFKLIEPVYELAATELEGEPKSQPANEKTPLVDAAVLVPTAEKVPIVRPVTVGVVVGSTIPTDGVIKANVQVVVNVCALAKIEVETKAIESNFFIMFNSF